MSDQRRGNTAPPLLVFEVPGDPVGKGRIRVRVVQPYGKKPFASFFMDANTRSYEEVIRRCAVKAMRGHPPIEGTLAVVVYAIMEPPKSWSNKKRLAALDGMIGPDVKPDADNILKCLDACNGVVFVDDKQIIDARVIKTYGEKAMMIIEVRVPERVVIPIVLP